MNRLEKLEELVRLICEHKSNTYSELMNYLRDVRSSLKALEIIKKKQIDVNMFILMGNLERYNKYTQVARTQLLTQEEFNLLKKELEK